MSQVRQLDQSYCDGHHSASNRTYGTCSSAYKGGQCPSGPKIARSYLNADVHGKITSRDPGLDESDYGHSNWGIAENIPNEESLFSAPNLSFLSADFEYPISELTYESEVENLFSPEMHHSQVLADFDFDNFRITDGNSLPSTPHAEYINFCSSTSSYDKPSITSKKSGISAQDRKYADFLESNFCGPARCSWEGCTSRARFHNLRALNNHLNNIHLKPLVCDVEGCGYQKPFRNKYDLERHRQTAHLRARNHECPFVQCQNLGFARKDKLWVHIRECHDSSSSACDSCPVIHCGKDVAAHVSEHMQKEHGSFECGLSNCGKRQSRFTEVQLENHLRDAHGIYSGEASRAVAAAKKVSDKTIRRENLCIDTKVRDCVVCRL